MKKLIYQTHLTLGILVSIPVLAWALSGFLYALPNMVEGGTVENIDASRIKISAPEAISKANELAGKQLPTTALTLLMKDGRPVFQSIGGLGADSIFIDAETGEEMSDPPTAKTRLFREAHFYYFAGSWQVVLLLIFSGLAALSAATGIYLNISYWSRRIRRSASAAN
jgi:uncharacterized iron-regulated membrane protein